MTHHVPGLGPDWRRRRADRSTLESPPIRPILPSTPVRYDLVTEGGDQLAKPETRAIGAPLVSTRRVLAAGFEVGKEENQVIDVHATAWSACPRTIIKISRIGASLKRSKEVEQSIHIDAAIWIA